MRYYEFGDHAIVKCIGQEVHGATLLEIFRSSANDDDIADSLKLKLSEVGCLRHLVNQSQLGKYRETRASCPSLTVGKLNTSKKESPHLHEGHNNQSGYCMVGNIIDTNFAEVSHLLFGTGLGFLQRPYIDHV